MTRGAGDRKFGNQIFDRLSADDMGLLEPYLEAVDLPRLRRLELRNHQIEHIYFLQSGIASVVADGSDNRAIEVGLIGREGMTGLAVVMASERTPFETFMQVGGGGHRITADSLRSGMAESASLHRTMLRYGQTFFVQTAHTAQSNGRGKLEERLARWLLMVHDRVDGDELSLTHELVSIMLGVRRPGVTVAVNLFEKAGLIRTGRGQIRVIDRAGLEDVSNGSYGEPEAEYKRLLGQ